MDRAQKIKEKIKCCACGGSLADSKEINIMLLMKEAEWKHPTWGNIILRIQGFASAILCDKCLKEGKKPKWAIEWNQKTLVAKYHPIEELKDVPKEIFEPLEYLEPGYGYDPRRHGIAG